MTLAEFIRTDIEGILDEWIVFAASIPAAKSLDEKSLRNDARKILGRIATEMELAQTDDQRDSKSRGELDTQDHKVDSAAQTHATARLSEGFTLPDMISEYRALRASVMRRWMSQGAPGPDSLAEATKFHEGMDQAVAESTRRFTDRVDRARELFMGALGHDLRTPLHVIIQCAQYLSRPETPTRTHAQLSGYIGENAERIHDMIEDLLDVVQTKLGGSMPIKKQHVDLVRICIRAVNEVRIAHPGVAFITQMPNALFGSGDAERLNQLIMNLLKNAIQHGDNAKPITITAEQDATHAAISVHNEGKAIPEELIPKLFEPLTRGEHIPEYQRGSSLGLGLYIANTIACAHGGRMEVKSRADQGTTFTVCLPQPSPVS